MAILDIFVSFEFDKDTDLRNSFYRQAKYNTTHRVRDSSLKQDYPEEIWRDKAKEAIRKSDVVIVLIGEDTHNAPGVQVEVKVARNLNKPIFQVRPQKRPYNGLTGLDDPIAWRWKTINKKLDEVKPL